MTPKEQEDTKSRDNDKVIRHEMELIKAERRRINREREKRKLIYSDSLL